MSRYSDKYGKPFDWEWSQWLKDAERRRPVESERDKKARLDALFERILDR